MSRSLLGEIAHQLFSSPKEVKPKKKSKKDYSHNYYNKVMYEAKKAAFESQRAYEDAETRAYIKGWKK